jgi:hypothetical protein
VFIDHLDARSVLILVDPAACIQPAALFVEASEAFLEDRETYWDTGRMVQMGVSYDNGG